jgi:hypothetical protein
LSDIYAGHLSPAAAKNKDVAKWLKPLRSLLLAAACIILLLFTLLLSDVPDVSENITLRSVSVGLPPPPPPPPSPVETTTQTTTTQMDLLANIEHGIALATAKIQPPKLQPPSLPQLDIRSSMPELDSALSFNWDGLGLSELDQTPRLLTAPKIRFPNNLRSRGVSRVLVELNVMIDESGRVFLKEIVKNPHPQLNSEIRLLTQRARFTPPKKDSKPARAVFIWPLEFSDE